MRLLVARETSGMTQPELAEVIEASRGTVSNYERGAVTPRRTTIVMWALATGVDLHWLETGHAPSPDGDGACTLCAIRDSNPEPADLESVTALALVRAMSAA
ncbi:immunity repressor [Gordonia phage SallySpecial]|uniref:Immunity repressor n=1 Tax=Gordonia phage SallySpecial TaxID=2079570 RepID=A0A2P1CC24_9CAUD|nr:transcriptional repressor [Gordonia phage SallySpecial]AVJ48766.1 immunity repressor [Gordonia phage SallySpecial]